MALEPCPWGCGTLVCDAPGHPDPDLGQLVTEDGEPHTTFVDFIVGVPCAAVREVAAEEVQGA